MSRISGVKSLLIGGMLLFTSCSTPIMSERMSMNSPIPFGFLQKESHCLNGVITHEVMVSEQTGPIIYESFGEVEVMTVTKTGVHFYVVSTGMEFFWDFDEMAGQNVTMPIDEIAYKMEFPESGMLTNGLYTGGIKLLTVDGVRGIPGDSPVNCKST